MLWDGRFAADALESSSMPRMLDGSPEGAAFLPSHNTHPGSAVEDQRDGAVVDELDLHVRPEPSGLDTSPELTQRSHEGLDQRLGLLWPGRVTPAGTATLAGVGVEGELADHERRAAHLRERPVHHTGGVVEDAQVPD